MATIFCLKNILIKILQHNELKFRLNLKPNNTLDLLLIEMEGMALLLIVVTNFTDS